MRDVTIIDVARRRSRDFAQLIDDRTDHASPTHHPLGGHHPRAVDRKIVSRGIACDLEVRPHSVAMLKELATPTNRTSSVEEPPR